MRALSQDFRFAVRMLLRSPGVSLVAIITLALALGANTAIFSVVQSVLLRPLPFPDPERLVVLAWKHEGRGMETQAFSYPNYADVIQATSFAGGGGYTLSSGFLLEGQEPLRIYGAQATASTFPALGVQPALGRFYTEREDAAGAEKVLVISHRLWQREFHGDAGVIGRPVRFGSSGGQRTIIGVMPPDFQFPVSTEGTDFWIPLVESTGEALTSRGAIWMGVFARLKPGVSLAAANAELAGISTRLAEEYPNNEGMEFFATPLHDDVVGDVRPALLVLLASVGTVLLIGCANVANLLLARAAGRRREIAVRTALGATRGRIVRQLLVESLVLALVAGVAGLLLAAWSIDLLLALAPADIPRIDRVNIDGTVLLFTFGLSMLTGLVFGLVPALGASKSDLNETLKEGSRGSTEGRGRSRVRNALVVAEITLSIVLLVSAGLLIRSFLRVTAIDPGFDHTNVVQLDLSARANINPESADVARFYERLLARIATLPGVESVGSASTLPLDGNESVYGVNPIESPPSSPSEFKVARHIQVMPGIFETLRIPLLAGRGFTPRDDASSPAVAVVNEAFVKEHYPNENPIGRTINITDGDGERQIVGIVADVRFEDLAQPAGPAVWVSQLQDPSRRQQVVVRTTSAPGPMLAAMRGAVREIDREQPILAASPFGELIRDSLARRRFSMTLLAILAGLALMLAAVGIYSVMSYSVTQRTSEIGIRMALGADSRSVLKMIVRGALKLVALGVLGGILVAIASGRILQSFLFGVEAHDPVTLAVIATLLAAVGLVASWLPARRAARVDPLEAIRYE